MKCSIEKYCEYRLTQSGGLLPLSFSWHFIHAIHTRVLIFVASRVVQPLCDFLANVFRLHTPRTDILEKRPIPSFALALSLFPSRTLPTRQRVCVRLDDKHSPIDPTVWSARIHTHTLLHSHTLAHGRVVYFLCIVEWERMILYTGAHNQFICVLRVQHEKKKRSYALRPYGQRFMNNQ